MRKLFLILAFLAVSAVGYCSLPLTSVAVLTVTLTDQTGGKIELGASATFLDAEGSPIATITFETPSSWSNNLHWWAHSDHPASTWRPADARRVATVEIAAKGCETVQLPVVLQRHYEPLSFAPHGGGPAYFIYRYNRSVVLQCG